MTSREDRIANLAATLKAAGLAKSEVQARMMAEEMIGVEENVQRRYDEEHAKAQEYLKTAKNLGNARPRYQEANPEALQQMQTRKIEPLPKRSADEEAHDKKVLLEEVKTDVDFGKGTLKDLMMNQIKEDNHPVKNIEEMKSHDEETFSEEDISSTKNIPDPAQIVNPQPITPESSEENGFFSNEDLSSIEAQEAKAPTDVDTPMSEEISPDELPDPDKEKFFSEEDTTSLGPEKVEVPVPESQLDGKKLQDLMEEDGPMEEHTREIKDKPKVVKPKEEYAENSVDLNDMFNVNK